jgi:hypothetical protein
MPLVHRIPALILLTAFIAGGLVAPAVHQAEHALEYQRRAEASRLAHAGHVHDGDPALETGPALGAAHTPCLLCHIRWDSTVDALFAPVPGLLSVPYAGATPSEPPSAALQHLPIRGPPAVA